LRFYFELSTFYPLTMENLEGRQSVFAALTAWQRKVQVILVSASTHMEKLADLLALAQQRGVPIKRVQREELDALAHGSTHGGVIAICTAKPRLDFAELEQKLDELREVPLLLLLEGVDDGRNLGFTLRSAEAFGVHAVLVKKHLWDFDAVEVARSSSGAYERLPLVQVDSSAPLEKLRWRGLKLFGCVAGATRTIFDVDLAVPTILAIGGEKRGLSGATRDLCDQIISIPTIGGATSLALSHAAAVVMAEARRRRILDFRLPILD
jgi:23S rRNA (guanosine2251-2'-O)-methyltransferase